MVLKTRLTNMQRGLIFFVSAIGSTTLGYGVAVERVNSYVVVVGFYVFATIAVIFFVDFIVDWGLSRI